MNETGLRRTLPDQSSASGHTFGTPRHPSIIDPILSKRVCFYKSGDPQFSGLRLVINNRTFKTFDALLDSLSKKVPLPFGVRNITTPRGVHSIYTLDELEDGKSYICSDSRKVKPINLALARKKLPPWYNARPVSSRRRTVQQAKFFPGRSKQEPAVVRTPKKLLVFRNGDPTIKHTVVLHKKRTPSYESILEYISALMQFHVVKLYTPDGRRVDGFPGLILCSGTVVAVGRESFRPAVYSAQKSPTRLHTSRMDLRRQKVLHRKKKLLSYPSKSRNFSSSSERYIVQKIHNTIAESSSGMPSNPTNSVEFESNPILESVAETEGDTCLGDGAEGQDCLLPSEDDIEKSFRVNQDGSMTVEMKVRLTIKEEETIHWTTTLKRSSAANQLNVACLPEIEGEQEICSPVSNSLDLQSPAASINTINKYKTKDNNDDDPPSLSNGVFSKCSNEEDDVKNHADVVSLRRGHTPGRKQVSKKQASVESIRSVTADGIQEGTVGSYSYREETENGTMTEQYCMVKQSSTRPIPKPRRIGSVDSNSRNVSAFKSAGMTEILQIDSSGEEVNETVLHIYEQQTHKDNFLANVYANSMPASGNGFSRPATSETGHLSSSNEFEPELWRPSTASESMSIYKAESTSATSNLNLPSLKSVAFQATNRQQQFQKPTKGQLKPSKTEVSKDKRLSLKPKVVNKHVRRLMMPGKRLKENSAGVTETRKKVKTFSSAGFIKRIYGKKSKSTKGVKRLKKRPTQNKDGSAATNSLELSDDTIKSLDKDSNIPSALKENVSERVSFETTKMSVSPPEVSQPRGILTRQTSMHKEKIGKSYDISESMSLPAFNSSSSITNKYVENWLEKAHLNPQTENGRCGESEHKYGSIIVAEEVKKKCLEETSAMQTCQTSEPPPGSLPVTSVKLRVQSFENKSSPAVEKTTVSKKTVHNHTTTTNTDSYNSLSRNNVQEIKPLSNGICPEIIPPTNKTSTETPLGGEVENISSQVKISFQNATPSLSMDLPPPPPAEDIELSNTEYCMNDLSAVSSSPLYRLSSLSSQRDNHPLSISPTSDEVIAPKNTTETTTSVQGNIPSMLSGTPLQRTPSIKRAPLVSNVSLERKMSLRKACVDKHTLSNDATLSSPINTVSNDVSGTQPTVKAPPEETQQSEPMRSPSCCTSVSPPSSTTEDRMSSASFLSSEASMPQNLPFKETKTAKMQFLPQKEALSPKTPVKKVKLISSPSPERMFQNKKSSFELPINSPKLPSAHRSPLDKTISANVGELKHATLNASPSAERKQKLHKPKLQKRPSPYSQSLDMVSPPVRHKTNRKLLSRSLSSDNQSDPTNKTQRKTSLQRKSHQRSQSVKSTDELDKPLTCSTLRPLDADQSDENKTDLLTADQEKSSTDMQQMPQPLNTANQQPNMKPVLEKICYSIKSIRQITQNKRPSCLEKSNSLPDFSSHVASTFGSSSKALLAFLSVMTLKEGITNLNVDELNANNVSCAEALKMIDSLRVIASIEDSHKLRASLSDLQRSASKQLLQSWKGFQELSDRCKSRSSTRNSSEQELKTEAGPEQHSGIDENVIDEIMDNLDIPEKLKEELASFSESPNSESDNEENMSARITGRVELSPKDNSDENTNLSSTEDEKTNVDVRSIIKKFTYIDQPKQSGMTTETAKHKPNGQETKDDDDRNVQNYVTKCPKDEPRYTQIPEERQLYNMVQFVQDNGEELESCRDAMHQENQEEQKKQQGQNEDKSPQERANMSGVVSSKMNLEEQNCNFETEEQEVECRRLQMHREESVSVPEKELTHDDETDSDEEGQEVSGQANKDLAQKGSCRQRLSSSEVNEQHSSEDEEAEVACEEIKPESSDGEDLSNPESLSEEEDDKQPSSKYYVELNARGQKSISSPDSENQFLSEEEQLEVEQQSHTCNMGLNVSVDESTGDSDEQYSEEEQPEVECKELQVIVEESSSVSEEEQEVMEGEHLHKLPEDGEEMTKLKTVMEETEEDQVSSGDEDLHADETQICNKTKSQSTVGRRRQIENQDSYTKKDDSSLMKSAGLARCFRFNSEGDSGNDHSSCEEHIDEEQLKVEDEQISSSIEEELSYYEKEFSFEEEQATMNRYTEECQTQYQRVPALEKQSEVTECENVLERLKPQCTEIISQSVAERVILLEKQVADAKTRKNTTKNSAIRSFSQLNAPPESDAEDSPSESQLAHCTRSAPQSSLSFSYDSSGIITTEPEGNRVRSIREMFLAKSATEIQPSPNASQLSRLRPETSASCGYQSQTSSELSSGEDDSARKSITKGFVRRTIERLYGKKDANPDEEARERPPSEPKQKKREHSSIFSPFHTAHSKAMSELSYFNSSNALDTLSEATRCIAFNAQVGPDDSVPIDNGRWLLRENTLIRKSVSDPVGINKTFTDAPQDEGECEDTEESTPYSLFSTKPELEDKTKSMTRKCTYLALPHASDSDACQDDLSTLNKSSTNGDLEAKDNSEDPKTCAERNGVLPGVAVTDFKMMDNKVHPLVELPPDGEVVVVQPGRSQGVVNRRLPDPDMLDLLYNFCGQHCPIL